MTDLHFLAFAFSAGAASSIGPCIAPRYAILAAQIARGGSLPTFFAFGIGSLVGYVVFASAGSIAALLNVSSHLIYGITSCALLGAGVHTLLSSECRVHRQDINASSLGAPFLSGVGCSVLGSPCCAPIAVAVGFQSAHADLSCGAVALLMFGAGHLLPLVGMVGVTRSPAFRNIRVAQEIRSTISGTVLTAVAGLYAAVA